MTPLEGETAIAGLVLDGLVPTVILGVLLVRRIWRVTTKTDPKTPPVPPPAAEADTRPLGLAS